MKYCHVIGQVRGHDEVEIILTTEALEELQRAINLALVSHDNSSVRTNTLYCTDGEGYKLSIHRMSPEDDMLKFKPPYEDLYNMFEDGEE